MTITSYNSTGFPVQRQLYIKKLQLFSDVICVIQLKNLFNFKPAVKANNKLGQGRPKGGLFMAWKKIQVKKATRIICDNFQIQAAILEYESCKLLLINTYFLCDSQNVVLSIGEAQELQNILYNINSIKEKYATKFDTLIVLGDINCDDTRYTGHTLAVNTFLEIKDFAPHGTSSLLILPSLLDNLAPL